jgi:hypothetical protein
MSFLEIVFRDGSGDHFPKRPFKLVGFFCILLASELKKIVSRDRKKCIKRCRNFSAGVWHYPTKAGRPFRFFSSA